MNKQIDTSEQDIQDLREILRNVRNRLFRELVKGPLSSSEKYELSELCNIIWNFKVEISEEQDNFLDQLARRCESLKIRFDAYK